MTVLGSRVIFWIDAITSFGRSASLVHLAKRLEVGEGLDAVAAIDGEPSTGELVLRSWMSPRVMSGRSWSMAVSMLATTVAIRRRAARLLCSTRTSLSRRMVKIVDAPNPMISTMTISTVIFVVNRNRISYSQAPALRCELRSNYLAGCAKRSRCEAAPDGRTRGVVSLR